MPETPFEERQQIEAGFVEANNFVAGKPHGVLLATPVKILSELNVTIIDPDINSVLVP